MKGAIWQVLPVLGHLLKVFEEARQDHLPTESQHVEKQRTPATPPPSNPSPAVRRTTHRSQYTQSSQISAMTDGSNDNIASAAIQPVEVEPNNAGDAKGDLQSDDYLTSQHHFNHNINAAWQKLDYYFRQHSNIQSCCVPSSTHEVALV